MDTTTTTTSQDPWVEELLHRDRGTFIFVPDAHRLTGLTNAQIEHLVKYDEEFPKPVRLSSRRIAFVLGEVLDWRERVKTERRGLGMSPKLAEAVKRGGEARQQKRREQEAA